MKALLVLALLAGVAEAAPKKHAVVILLDRSGSMRGSKLEAAKTATLAALAALDPTDTVAIVAFDSETFVLVRPQSAANKSIAKQLARFDSGGGTNLYIPLREAKDILHDIKADAKHVIMLSDGDAPSDGISELEAEMVKAKITISTIGLTDADDPLLEAIATDGGGRYHQVGDLRRLTTVFVGEIKASR